MNFLRFVTNLIDFMQTVNLGKLIIVECKIISPIKAPTAFFAFVFCSSVN